MPLGLGSSDVASTKATAQPSSLSSAQHTLPGPGCIRRWPPLHLLLAVAASANDKRLDDLQENLKRKLSFAFQEEEPADLKRLEASGFETPSRFALAKGRINLDLAAMCCRRDQHQRPHTCWRQLNFDSSPQGGMELLAVTEFTTYNSAVETSESHKLPIQSLGFGYGSVVDKAEALVHSIALECGAELEMLRSYTSSVYVILTDPGVEQHIGELPDVTAAFAAGGDATQVNFDPTEKLFPLALRVLDWSHLWHWQLKSLCESFVWFKAWQAKAAAVATLMTTKSYVDTLASTFQQMGATAAEVKVLRSFKSTLITWRFGSLAAVAEDLCQVRPYLCLVWGQAPMRFKDTELNKKLSSTIPETLFWQQCRVLKAFASSTEMMRLWGLGCSCHEQQLREASKRGETFHCPWKSMRGPEVYWQVQAFLAALETSVHTLVADDDIREAGLGGDLLQGQQLLSAHVQLKFGYANQMPWLLWRCRLEPAVAKQILDSYDFHIDKISRGERSSVHRLHSRFAAPAGPLRRHLEVRSA